MPYVWIAVVVLSIVAEISTVSLVAIWFMPSAIISMILAFFGVPVPIQVLVFLAVSAVLIICSRTIFKKALFARHVPTNADAVIGETALITEDVCNIESRGLAKVRGQVWSARSADGEELRVGELVTVVAIEGVKLICKKKD